MSTLLIPLEVIGALCLLCLLVLLALLIRRVRLIRRPGAFDLSIREDGGPWSIGVAQYVPGRLEFHNVFSLSPRPSRALQRHLLEIVDHSQLPAESGGASAAIVVHCRHAGRPVDLSMNVGDYLGLSTWAESAPPGQVYPRR